MQSISVSTQNQTYASFDGMVFSKDLTRLLLVPEGKEGAVTIPDATTSVPAGALSQSARVTSLSAGDGSTAFASENGILYSKDKKTLIACPGGYGDAVVIPEAVEAIGPDAFAGSALASIVVLGNVLTIDSTSFSDKINAQASVAIPDGKDYEDRKKIWEVAGFTLFAEPARPGDSFGARVMDDLDASGFSYVLLPDMTLAVSWVGDIDPESDLAMPASANLDGLTYRVSQVADEAFKDRSALKSIAIPPSIASIGNSAFEGCVMLKSVFLAEGLDSIGRSAFESTALERVFLPKSVESIGSRSFANCTNLKRIVAHSNIPSVAGDVIAECFRLSVYYPKNDEKKNYWTVGALALDNHIVPYGLSLPQELRTLEVGQSVNFFEGGYCEDPEDFEVIYSYAAESLSVSQDGTICAKKEGSSEIDAILTVNGVEVARSVCSVEVIQPPPAKESLRKTGAFVSEPPFSNLSYFAISRASLGPGSEFVVGSWRYEVLTGTDVSVFPSVSFQPTVDLVIPSTVQYSGTIYTVRNIGESAFEAYPESQLSGSLTIPDTVTSISGNAFYCTGLSGTLVIPKSVKTIGQYAFGGVPGDTGYDCIVIPPSVTSIGDGAFHQGGYGYDQAVLLDFSQAVLGSSVLAANNFADVYCLSGRSDIWGNANEGQSPQPFDMAIKLNPSSLSLKLNPAELAASAYGPVNNFVSYSWKSSNSAVASVSSDAGASVSVIPHVSGNAIVTVSMKYDGIEVMSKTCSVSVKQTAKISFQPNGGSAVGPLTVQLGTLVTAPTTPTRLGYTFQGWYKESSLLTPWNFSVDIVANDMTLYAKWTPNAYTVAYSANGATGTTDSQTLTYDTAANLATNGFTKTGYTFVGWNTLANGTGTNYTAGSSQSNLATSGTFTLYAKWTTNTYNVAFDCNGGDGTLMTNQTFTYDAAKALTANTYTKTGYSFAGWNTRADGAGASYTNQQSVSNLVASGTVTLYAKWAVNSYALSFVTNGGSSVTSQTVAFGAKATAPANPTKLGYTFVGWYKESALTNAWTFTTDTMPASNTTLYAKWTPNTYTVAFNANGGTGTMADQTGIVYGVATNLKANTFTKEGHTFAGWSKTQTGSVAFTDTAQVTSLVTSGTTTLYAIWTPNSYNVVFDLGGGSGITTPVKVDYGSKVSDPGTPTKAGYTFKGWYKDAAKTVAWNFATDTAGTATTIYAKWAANTYAVHFDGSGGAASPIMVDQTFTYDAAAKALSKSTFTKQGYLFAGWSKTQGGVKDFADEATVANLATSGTVTLYAVWTPITYSVHFNATTGSGTMADQAGITYGVATPLVANVFTKQGHTFAGWATTETGTSVYVNQAPVTNLRDIQGATANLWATWTTNTYTVTFQSNEGSTINPLPAVFGTVISAPTPPTRQGYVFVGWFRDAGFSIAWDFAKDKIAGDMTLYACWSAVVDVDVPIDPKISIDAQGSIITGEAANKSFASRSAKPVAVIGVTCATTATTKSIFSDESQWPGIKMTLTEPGKPYDGIAVGLGKSARPTFVIPAMSSSAASELSIAFGLDLPANVALAYVESTDSVPVAKLSYTFALLE